MVGSSEALFISHNAASGTLTSTNLGSIGTVKDAYATGVLLGLKEGYHGTTGGLIGDNLGYFLAYDDKSDGLASANQGSIGAIENAYATGPVTSYIYSGGAGGLVGQNSAYLNFYHADGNGGKTTPSGNLGRLATVSDSHATGDVVNYTDEYAFGGTGGLVGFNVASYSSNTGVSFGKVGDIDTVFATGSVQGYVSVGGLVGEAGGLVAAAVASTQSAWVHGVGGHVSNAYSTGNVTGTNNVGGLVGRVGHSAPTLTATEQTMENNTITLDTVYSTGRVDGASSVGGLVGTNYGNILNAYSQSAVNVTRWDTAGGLVGVNHGHIEYSHSSGPVNGVGGMIGGLVGLNAYGATIHCSYSESNVTGTQSNIGGLVGQNEGSIEQSYSRGEVQGDYKVGGLVGYNSGSITNTFSNSPVTGVDYVGGLVGYNNSQVDGGEGLNVVTQGIIDKTYSAGKVIATGPVDEEPVEKLQIAQLEVVHMGGLVGYDATEGAAVTNSFWDIQTSGQNTSAGGTGMTTAQMMAKANYTEATIANGGTNPGWDFATVWAIYEGGSYPFCQPPCTQPPYPAPVIPGVVPPLPSPQPPRTPVALVVFSQFVQTQGGAEVIQPKTGQNYFLNTAGMPMVFNGSANEVFDADKVSLVYNVGGLGKLQHSDMLTLEDGGINPGANLPKEKNEQIRFRFHTHENY